MERFYFPWRREDFLLNESLLSEGESLSLDSTKGDWVGEEEDAPLEQKRKYERTYGLWKTLTLFLDIPFSFTFLNPGVLFKIIIRYKSLLSFPSPSLHRGVPTCYCSCNPLQMLNSDCCLKSPLQEGPLLRLRGIPGILEQYYKLHSACY